MQISPSAGCAVRPRDNSAGDDLWLPQMAWAIPSHSKNAVNRAGNVLVGPIADAEGEIEVDENGVGWSKGVIEYFQALDTINNWRSSHNFPLNTFQIGLRRRVKQIDRKALIAQRIKRMSSIEAKLLRFPTMTLSQMQDIGGCRAILRNVRAVRALCHAYESSSIKHKLHHIDDYIEKPKESGYRGVHLIYRYYSDKKEEYNSLLIEMQLRSQMQHAWATAVEVVGAFVDQALKSSIGEHEWLRFFALMGSAIAVRERTPLVPNTFTNYADLVGELRDHAKALDIANKLTAFGTAVSIYEGHKSKDDHYYLVEVDHTKRIVNVTGFKQSQSQLATDRYLDAEKKAKELPSADAVLVSVDSMSALQRAYPNYFLDTRLFLNLLESTLSSTRVPTKSEKRSTQLPLL